MNDNNNKTNNRRYGQRRAGKNLLIIIFEFRCLSFFQLETHLLCYVVTLCAPPGAREHPQWKKEKQVEGREKKNLWTTNRKWRHDFNIMSVFSSRGRRHRSILYTYFPLQNNTKVKSLVPLKAKKKKQQNGKQQKKITPLNDRENYNWIKYIFFRLFFSCPRYLFLRILFYSRCETVPSIIIILWRCMRRFSSQIHFFFLAFYEIQFQWSCVF